jgi:hypothetical protein
VSGSLKRRACLERVSGGSWGGTGQTDSTASWLTVLILRKYQRRKEEDIEACGIIYRITDYSKNDINTSNTAVQSSA